MNSNDAIWQDPEAFEFSNLENWLPVGFGTIPDEDIHPVSVSAPPQRSPEFEELPNIPPRLAVGTGRFRCQATGMFLTYSQSALSRGTITEWFTRQLRVKRFIVGLEHHQDGNTHWHVLIEYDHKKDIRNERFFDIEGEHPNILTWDRAVTYEQWFYNHWNYCKKEDPTPFIVGEEPKENRKRKRDEKFTEAVKLARTESVNSGMLFLEKNAPYDLVTKYDAIFRALTKFRNEMSHAQSPARALSEFPLAPDIVGDWHCLYINGKTDLGKTQWARALLPGATIVSHRDQLRDCDFSKGVIFDDFEVSHWPPTAVIHLLDWDEPRGLDVKHGHVIIPAHTKKIFTTNCDFDRWVSKDATDSQVEACKRRVHVVNIHRRMY